MQKEIWVGGFAVGVKMSDLQYKTVAAPRRIKKMRDVKGKDAQIARAVQDVIQAETADGWRYLRTDVFPVEEAGGWFSKPQVVNRAVLVFARAMPQPAAQRPISQAPMSQAPAQQPMRAAPPLHAQHPDDTAPLPPLGGASRD